MDKKRSIALTIISRIEMVFGSLGVLLGLILLIMGLLKNEAEGILYGICWGGPALVMLITGELTFRLHPLGRIFHLILSYLIILLVILNLIQGSIKLTTVWLIILILSILLIVFFNSAYIKKQFEK
ncbi:MAG: hypothetical protein PHT41_00205 [Candidatus Omnitrophica bacterium]|nr:hypothetical protein [Candidatus Omnitrophota bacterium]MDD5237514.1 hypothetical protein [Candidatus Omnitrophota bacterium]